jgi:hypothetical protein
LRPAGDQLKRHLAAIEGRIYQVQNRSSQDPLNYPIMLNDKLAGVASDVEGAEAAPTAQEYTTFADLSQRLDRELAALNQVLTTELPAYNAKLAAAHLPPVERTPEAAVEQGSNRDSGVEEDQDEGA